MITKMCCNSSMVNIRLFCYIFTNSLQIKTWSKKPPDICVDLLTTATYFSFIYLQKMVPMTLRHKIT